MELFNNHVEIIGSLKVTDTPNGVGNFLTIDGVGNITVRTAAQTATDIGAELLANKGQNDGYAPLDSSGLIPTAHLPALAITETYVVASQAAMLALSAQTGDVAVRTDENKSYILAGSDPSVLGDWQELLTPTDAVQSVNGLTGVVQLDLSWTGATGMLGLTGSSDVDLGFTDTDIGNWNTAFSWGDHSSAGYVDATGTPAVTHLARFTDADTITGDAELTYTLGQLGIVVNDSGRDNGLNLQNDDGTGDIRVRWESNLAFWALGIDGGTNKFTLARNTDLGTNVVFTVDNTNDFRVIQDIIAEGDLYALGADVYVGEDDSKAGIVSIYGAGSGTFGGELDIYNSADYDTTNDYWRIRSLSGGLRIEPSGGQYSRLTLDSNAGRLFAPNSSTEVAISDTGVIFADENGDTMLSTTGTADSNLIFYIGDVDYANNGAAIVIDTNGELITGRQADFDLDASYTVLATWQSVERPTNWGKLMNQSSYESGTDINTLLTIGESHWLQSNHVNGPAAVAGYTWNVAGGDVSDRGIRFFAEQDASNLWIKKGTTGSWNRFMMEGDAYVVPYHYYNGSPGGNDTYASSKDLAQYAYSGSLNGTIKIDLGRTWENWMANYEISIFEYNSSRNHTIIRLNAYDYLAGTSWINEGCVQVGGERQYKVRLAHDTTNVCILISEISDTTENTSWDYPRVALRQVEAHLGADNKMKDDTMVISMISSIVGYTGVEDITQGWYGSKDMILRDNAATFKLEAKSDPTNYNLELQNNYDSANRFNIVSAGSYLFGRRQIAGASAETYVSGFYGISFITGVSEPTLSSQVDMFLTDNGDLGIGELVPLGRLHVKNGDSGTVSANPSADELIVENSSDTGINILSPDASLSTVRFGSPSDNSGAQIAWRFNDLEMTIGTATANGTVQFNSGNSVGAMWINANQYVGINNDSPNSWLNVRADNGNVDSLSLGRIDTATYWRFNHAGNDLRIFNVDGAGYDVMIGVNASGVDQGNDLSIGTASGSYRFNVNGDMWLANTYYLRTATNGGSNTRIHGINSSDIEYIGSIDAVTVGTQVGYNTGYVQFNVNGQNVGKFTDATNQAYFNIGVADQTQGLLIVNGVGAGEGVGGGTIWMRVAADHGSTIDRYQIVVSADDFLIGPSTDTDGILKFNGGTLETTLGNAGNVGIGAEGADAKFHVFAGAGSTPTISADTVAIFQNNAASGDDAFISIISGTSGEGAIYFGDSSDENRGRIEYNQAVDNFSFKTGGSSVSKLAVNNAGDVFAAAGLYGGEYTVATLPSAISGARCTVTDATSTTFHSIVSGGGSNYVPVFYDGTNWRIG